MSSVAPRIIEYLGSLQLAGGDHDGQVFEVLPWERRFIRGTWSTSGDAALSVGRGNGKSALVAGIASAVVDPDGPLHGTRREVVCVASSFQQGRVVYEDVRAFLEAGHDLGRRTDWRCQDSANVAIIEHRASGARVRCIGSDPKRMHGLRPALALLDEPAQWEPSKRDAALAALKTGLGKVPGSRLIALGTRPVGDHWFARMLRDGGGYRQVHAAPLDANPFHKRTWRRANPSLDHLPSLEARIRDEAAEARRDPAALASFRALRLNQGVADVVHQFLIDPDVWESVEGEADRRGAHVVGVNLGGSRSMCAAVAYWPTSGALRAMAMFPDTPGLAERARRDGAGDVYVRMQRRGELELSPGRVTDVSSLLGRIRERWGAPAAVVCDRWRIAELHDALNQAKFPRCRVVERGLGYKDGGADIRQFRNAILGGRVVPAPPLLLTASFGEAETVSDPAGNEKIVASRSRARDDAARAAVLAIAEGSRNPPQTRRRRFAVVP